MRTPHGNPPVAFSTQERAWASDFGNQYVDRNTGRVPANRHFFRKALAQARGINSVLEIGCGVGENLSALRQLYPVAHLEGIEINEKAAGIAREHGHLVRNVSILDYIANESLCKCDLTLSKGVLIHVPPSELGSAYHLLVQASIRWILIAEYYSPKPVEIEYRGQAGLLWKRDFAGELLNVYQELRLVDYGWVYHRDPYPQDDLTWMLLEKRQ